MHFFGVTVPDVVNTLTYFCIFGIGICCESRLGFRVLSPVVQLFGLFFFIISEGNCNQILSLLVTLNQANITPPTKGKYLNENIIIYNPIIKHFYNFLTTVLLILVKTPKVFKLDKNRISKTELNLFI